MRYLLALSLILAGCATHRRGGPPRDPQPPSVLRACEDRLALPPDGWIHYACLDADGDQWEVLARRTK